SDNMPGFLPLSAASKQSSKTDQAAAQQSDSAGFRNHCPWAGGCESRLRSAVCPGRGAEVHNHIRELACEQATGGEREGKLVDAHDPVRRALNVGVIEGEGTELADVLSSLEIIEAQSRISV